ncbi:MAG: YqiA/YcfP family alpha/beta fold hydrolase [Pseudomonadota bacterium]
MSVGRNALVYIHGFQSSPQSAKARQLGADLARRHAAVRYVVPPLGFAPAAALATLEEALAALRADGLQPVLVGSSMGGFYATVLAVRHGLRAVLVNPAVRPHELMQDFLGPVTNPYSGEHHVLGADDVAAFRALAPAALPRPQDFLVLLQTGDETLDWRAAADYYRDCSVLKQVGGSHGFENFEDMFPLIYRFAGLNPLP